MIEVSYDGEWPARCRGTLIIKVDGKEIYNEGFCCVSTGSVWFDSDWGEHVELGELKWKDAKNFSTEIQKAVEKELSNVEVCCGGCA